MCGDFLSQCFEFSGDVVEDFQEGGFAFAGDVGEFGKFEEGVGEGD